MKQRKPELVDTAERGTAEVGMIAIEDMKTHRTFPILLAVSEELSEEVTQDMRAYRFCDSAPEHIVAHMSIRAGSEAEITHVPFALLDFQSEPAAAAHVIELQTRQRSTNDGERYGLCERFDRLNARGGDLRSRQAEAKAQRCAFESKGEKSARRTATLIGCSVCRVERLWKVRKHGTPAIQWDVRTNKMTINRAYSLIRQM